VVEGISWAICKSAPCSRQITMPPSPHHSGFLQAGCPSCRPTNGVKALNTTKSDCSIQISSITSTDAWRSTSCWRLWIHCTWQAAGGCCRGRRHNTVDRQCYLSAASMQCHLSGVMSAANHKPLLMAGHKWCQTDHPATMNMYSMLNDAATIVLLYADTPNRRIWAKFICQ